jgi:hypothetical protein
MRFVNELTGPRGAPDMVDAESLPTAKVDGVYLVGKGQFRFKRGDKIPPNAVLITKKSAAAKGSKKGPAETTQVEGASEHA